MHILGRLLQLTGLMIVPMALFFYWRQEDLLSQTTLMFGELFLLGLGAGLFYLGRLLERR